MDILASGLIGSEGDSAKAFSFLELYGCREFIDCVTAHLVTVVSTLDVSLDGDDTVQSGHLEDQVGVVRNRHELGMCQPPQKGIVRCLEVGYLKLQIFYVEVFSSPQDHEKSDLTNRSRCCSRDHTMEWSPTGV
jgi:hypothetical protein